MKTGDNLLALCAIPAWEIMEKFVWFLLFVNGNNCEAFYNNVENSFLDNINGMDMSFEFGDRFVEKRVEVDNVGTTAQTTHVDDYSVHVEMVKMYLPLHGLALVSMK